MGAIINGIVAGSIYPQSDFSASQNENGGWTASQSFIIKKGGLDLPTIQAMFPVGTRATTLDPNCDRYYYFLQLVNISSASNVEGGFTRITVEYVGFFTSEFEAGTADPKTYPTYSLRGTIAEKPFMEHPKWTALDIKFQIALGKLQRGELQMSYEGDTIGSYTEDEGDGRFFALARDVSGAIVTLTGDALEFAKRIAQGETTYKVGAFEWAVRWQGASGLKAAQLNSLSRISNPLGTPPTPNGGRNWMLVSANQEQQGIGDFCFTNEIVWSLSERGGHDSFLYPE